MTTMDDGIRKKLENPFSSDKVKTKPGRGRDGGRISYISHGLITERLNDADPGWSSRHVATHTYAGADGLLHCAGVELEVTVGGVSRVESGGPQRQDGFGNEIKNAYSDALKRAAMRFGVALGMWEQLVDAEGDEDYDQPHDRPDSAPDAPVDFAQTRGRRLAGAADAPVARGTNQGSVSLQALHAAIQGKVEGEPHLRLHALAEAVYGVPSLRELNQDQADRLRKALGECREPRDGEALIALAIRINAATDAAELKQAANDTANAHLGEARRLLLLDAHQRSRKAIELMAEVGAGQAAEN